MKLLNILSILLLVITPTIWAQEQDYNAELVDTVQHVPILVEHAGMATGVVTDVEVIPFKKVQWETSFEYDYSNDSHAIYLPITAIRVGVSHFAEMSIETSTYPRAYECRNDSCNKVSPMDKSEA